MRRSLPVLLVLALGLAGPVTAAHAADPPQITSGPSGPVNVTTATFAYTLPNGTTARCGLDGAEPTACPADGVTYEGLAAGPHTFAVHSVDGEVVSAAATRAWTVDTTRPTITIAPVGMSLTAGRSMTFSEPVDGVGNDTVRIHVEDTKALVATRVVCLDAAKTRVSCDGDSVRGAVVTPVSPLVPGQDYDLWVEGLRDRAGNEAFAEFAGIRAISGVPEDSPGAVPAWRKVPSSRARGGSYAVSGTRLASARFAFTGSRVVWYGMTGPRYGTADVYVDSTFVRRVSFYAPADGTTYKVFGGLSNAKHTLKIVVRGERGSANGSGTLVSVDAMKVGSTTTASPALRYTWGRRYSPSTSYGRYAVENAAGATYKFRFRGTRVSWETMLGPDMGLARLSVDGVDKGVFDLWQAENNPFDPITISGLTDAVHTLTITVLGRARPGSRGTYVAVDQFGSG